VPDWHWPWVQRQAEVPKGQRALRRQHVEVEELVFPDEVHDFLLYRTWLAAYQAAASFLERKLK